MNKRAETNVVEERREKKVVFLLVAERQRALLSERLILLMCKRTSDLILRGSSRFLLRFVVAGEGRNFQPR